MAPDHAAAVVRLPGAALLDLSNSAGIRAASSSMRPAWEWIRANLGLGAESSSVIVETVELSSRISACRSARMAAGVRVSRLQPEISTASAVKNAQFTERSPQYVDPTVLLAKGNALFAVAAVLLSGTDHTRSALRTATSYRPNLSRRCHVLGARRRRHLASPAPRHDLRQRADFGNFICGECKERLCDMATAAENCRRERMTVLRGNADPRPLFHLPSFHFAGSLEAWSGINRRRWSTHGSRKLPGRPRCNVSVFLMANPVGSCTVIGLSHFRPPTFGAPR